MIRCEITGNSPRRYCVYVSVGEPPHDVRLIFKHISCGEMFSYETDAVFEFAAKELEKIYTKYGRFASESAVINLFESYGFELA